MPWNSTWPIISNSVKANGTPGVQNTAYIETTMKINHYWNGSNEGKHKQVDLPVLGSDLAAVLGEGRLYSKATGVGSDAQLFWRFANGALSPLQLTNNFFSQIATPGYIPLMGGMILQWGFNTIASGGTTLFGTEFTTAGVPSNGFVVIPIINAVANRHFIYTNLIGSTGFSTINLDSGGSPETSSFYWIALGMKT